VSDRDAAYGKFVRDNNLTPSTTMRETFNAGWHAALAALRDEERNLPTLADHVRERGLPPARREP